MKYLQTYEELGLDRDEVFDYLMDTMVSSVYGWDYYVDWEKVHRQFTEHKTRIEKLEDFMEDNQCSAESLAEFANQHPELRQSLLALIATRKSNLRRKDILYDGEPHSFLPVFQPTEASEDDYEELLYFFKESGLAEFLQDRDITSLTDYVRGVLAGMDTNARKNRGGQLMEARVKDILEDFLDDDQFIEQATAKRIRETFGYDFPTRETNTTVDFAVYVDGQLTVIEANHYSESGSKPSAIAGSYQDAERFYNKHDVNFIWVTDGHGWKVEETSLKEGFEEIDFVLNLHMAKRGALEELLST